MNQSLEKLDDTSNTVNSLDFVFTLSVTMATVLKLFVSVKGKLKAIVTFDFG